MKIRTITLFLFLLVAMSCNSNGKPQNLSESIPLETEKEAAKVVVGAERILEYLPLIEGKKVGMVVNNTAVVGDKHIVDILLEKDVKIAKVFAPEHGFRGEADAGAHINDHTDKQTGLPVVSIYGKTRKPTSEMMKGLDVVLFDIQDVGVRFYTYISTLHNIMNACGEYGLPLVVLDRPNPNGDYVAGNILDPKFKSFVGMHQIPIVHGLTVGELAQMINGEGWLDGGRKCDLHVVSAKNWNHKMHYSLPVLPSPNLPNDISIRLYPSLCLFEPTTVSIGRGTDFPFQVIGCLDKSQGNFEFTPRSIPGKSTRPKHEGEVCYGVDLRNEPLSHRFTLKYMVDFYSKNTKKDKFFTSSSFFNKLAGGDKLIQQIKAGMTAEEIEVSWQPELDKYKKMRKKYLLYVDFE
ncbi:MAG: exo-beta-N-acetylmuramidase NamZ domain-containing protein [Bacteroidales bacterium]